MRPDAKRPVRSGCPSRTRQLSSCHPIGRCFTITGHIDRIISSHLCRVWYSNSAGGQCASRDAQAIPFSNSYGTVLTDSNGNFSKSFCDDDGWFDDTLEIYYRLVTERRDGGGGVVYVEDSSWIDEKYEYDSNTVSSGGGTINYNLNLDMTWSGMFNIVDAASLARNLWRTSGDSYSEDVEIH
jgi:hypothetical protein